MSDLDRWVTRYFGDVLAATVGGGFVALVYGSIMAFEARTHVMVGGIIAGVAVVLLYRFGPWITRKNAWPMD